MFTVGAVVSDGGEGIFGGIGTSFVGAAVCAAAANSSGSIKFRTFMGSSVGERAWQKPGGGSSVTDTPPIPRRQRKSARRAFAPAKEGESWLDARAQYREAHSTIRRGRPRQR